MTARALKRAASALILAIFLPITDAVGSAVAAPQNASTGQAGVSEGAPGMADEERLYLEDLHRARKLDADRKQTDRNQTDKKQTPGGQPASASAGALIALGMHYNRKEQYSKACKVFAEAMLLTAKNDYETLEQLLPPMVQAETEGGRLAQAEVHVKRLIELARNNQIHQFPGLMFALNQYSRILTLTHRPAEAARYKGEAEKINSNIKGL